MGTEQRGQHPYRTQFAETAGHAQHLQLTFDGQTVTGLDLQRGHTIGQQRIETRQAGGDQFVLARCTSGAHAAENAATVAGDGFVADTFQALLELSSAVAGIDQMGVAVDQAWGHHAAAPHLDCTLSQRLVEGARRPQTGNATVLDQHVHRLVQLRQAIEDLHIAPELFRGGMHRHGILPACFVYTI